MNAKILIIYVVILTFASSHLKEQKIYIIFHLHNIQSCNQDNQESRVNEQEEVEGRDGGQRAGKVRFAVE